MDISIGGRRGWRFSFTRHGWYFLFRYARGPNLNKPDVRPLGFLIKHEKSKLFSERYVPETYPNSFTIGKLYFRTFKKVEKS